MRYDIGVLYIAHVSCSSFVGKLRPRFVVPTSVVRQSVEPTSVIRQSVVHTSVARQSVVRQPDKMVRNFDVETGEASGEVRLIRLIEEETSFQLR